MSKPIFDTIFTMGSLLTILIVIFILAIASCIRYFQIRRRHPPGPFGFPFLGILPLVLLQILFPKYFPKISQEKYFKQMKEKYGDLWSVYIGNQRVVVLASLDLLNEAFIENSKIFSGRPKNNLYTVMSKDRGIIFVDGDLWQGNRQLAFKALRELGMGKQVLESKICYEADDLIEKIEKKLSIPIASPDLFVKAVSNVISQLAFNERNEYNDDKFGFYIKNLKVIAHSHAAYDILEIFKKVLSMKNIRKVFSIVDEFMNSSAACEQFIADKCRSRIKIESEYSKPCCIFDYFWRYRHQDNPDLDPDEKFLDITHTMVDIFIAGTDTSTNLLSYCCLMLGQYPDIQVELRREIQSLVDDHKLINMEMKKDCPKLLSFIDEVQRYCHLVSVVQHRAIEPCILRGYKISDSDVIIGDIATSVRDPKLFENPDDFNPFRFMDKSRTKYVPNKSLIPFGIGKRACLGESIAAMELFLILSKIIQRFHISLPNETKTKLPETLTGTYGIVHAPLDHKIIFQLVQF